MRAQRSPGDGSWFVHAGTHKTGTTAIQRFLATNWEALKQAGLYYPCAGRRSADLPGHHNIAAELGGEANFNISAGALADVAAEVARFRAPSVCFSSERFATLHDRADALVALRDAIVASGYRPRIVVYVRAQPGYAESLYTELVKLGSARSMASYLDEIVTRGVATAPHASFRFEYGALIDGFARVFGPDAVIVRGYRDRGQAHWLIHDFLDAVGVAKTSRGTFVERAAYENRRLTTGDVITRLSANAAALLGDERFAAEGAGIVAHHRDDAEHPFMPLAPAERARIAARFADDNARLVRRRHVDPATFEDDLARRSDSEPARRARDLFAHAEATRISRAGRAL